MPHRNEPTLIRGLGLAASVSIVVGSVIGTGIFLKTRVMMCNVESPWLVIAVWMGAGLLTLAGALTYAELSAMMPHAGGEYVFLREAYGRPAAFLYGWTQFAVSYTGSQAAKGMSLAIFFNSLAGGQLGDPWLKAIALGAIILATVVNCLAVSVSGRVSVFLTGLKIGIVLAVSALAFKLAQGGWGHFLLSGAGGTCEGVSASARAGQSGLIAGFGAAMLGALWAYDGWTNVAVVAGEVKDPQRNLPLALIGGICLVGLLYLLVNFAYLTVLSPTEIASVPKASSVATEVVRKYLGPAAVAVMAMAMMISTLGSLHTGTLAGARISYAMARDGLFFRPFARLGASQVPVGSLIWQCAWTCLLALSGSFDRLTDYVMFASWIFYALVTSSIFVFRRRFPDRARPYRALGYPVVPALFLLAAGVLLVNALTTMPRESLLGLGIIALGLPLYWQFHSRDRVTMKKARTRGARKRLLGTTA